MSSQYWKSFGRSGGYVLFLVACLLCAEIFIRCIGHHDVDGNFYIRFRKLKPYSLPLKSVREKVTRYLATTHPSGLYDPVLGWTPTPDFCEPNPGYCYDGNGIRVLNAGQAFLEKPQRDILRIAIFGDSFVHGAQVPFAETWGYLLEQAFKKTGLQVEVLNFGAPGYGMDQALLRWRQTGRGFSPDIVIMGFQPENVSRNVNLLRPLYYDVTGIPFAKPRFVLAGKKLKLLNVPTPKPEEMAGLIEHVTDWGLLPYEYWYRAEDYRQHLWLKSKLIGLFLDRIENGIPFFFGLSYRRTVFALGREPAKMTLAILQAFREEVVSSGARFFVVHLPRQQDLDALVRGKELPYKELLKAVEAFSEVVRPEDAMARKAREMTVKGVCPRHYSKAGNEIVADTIFRFLQSEIGVSIEEVGDRGKSQDDIF
ncbi:MAG: SGNH/GDSL hydrolase family protein [Candidatus Omnitrophica bacterium]|nr:SGNH/GDSL hydrolase family protein [Candidatus Omnitrophota bacterium]